MKQQVIAFMEFSYYINSIIKASDCKIYTLKLIEYLWFIDNQAICLFPSLPWNFGIKMQWFLKEEKLHYVIPV